MTEKQLRDELKPTSIDYCIRVSFWREYQNAVIEQRATISARQVLMGVCSDAYFYQKFIKDDYRIAWLCLPVQSYMKEIEAVLLKGTERLWELMDLDIYVKTKDGLRPCARLAAVVLDAIKMVEARAKGHAVQRQETRSLTAVVKPQAAMPDDHATLERKVRKLTAELHGEPDTFDADSLLDENLKQ